MGNISRPGGAAGHVWDFFVSVKLTVATLAMLAFTSIFGTLIPQNQHAADYINAYGAFFFRFFDVFDLFNMYNSWWYRILIITLAGNILVCSLSRLSGTLAMVFRKKPAFKRLGIRQELSCERSVGEIKDAVEKKLSKAFKEVHLREEQNGFSAFAEKGAWTRLAFYGTHLGIIVLLFGALLGSLFGIDAHVNIPEGKSVGAVQLRNSGGSVPLGFEIQCNDFNIAYYNTGAVKEYRSSLVILENGKAVVKKDIIVNDPLTYKGFTLYQSSYGTVPARTKILNLTNQVTGESTQVKIESGKMIPFPDGAKSLTLKAVKKNYTLMGREVGETYVCEITQAGKATVEVALPTRFPSYDKMRKGEWILGVAKQEKQFYTGIAVTKDPGVWLVYTGFIMLLAGCFISFFMSHKKIFIAVTEDETGTHITVSGASNKNKLGIRVMVRQISEHLHAPKPNNIVS